MPLISVQDLRVYFHTEYGIVRAVDGVSYSIDRKTTLGIVGESGCGKSVTALSIMGLVPSPPGRLECGSVLYQRDKGTVDLARLSPRGKQMRSIRGNDIAMIFQEPMTSLNPVHTVGHQIAEAITLHQQISKKRAMSYTIEMLRSVGIPLPEQRADEYPHQLSGGMRQRAMIAMALSCSPSLLIADEPTTALDVTIQAQVLELMKGLQNDYEAAIQFITHDLGVIAGMAHNVVVMYLGRIVESASVEDLYRSPKHPYTQGLMNSIPSLASRKQQLDPIEGAVPSPFALLPGCGFEPRCPHAMEVCRRDCPELKDAEPGHAVACWLCEKEEGDASVPA